MDDRELYERVWNLSASSHERLSAESVMALVNREWPNMASRTPTPEDAETCRLAMLAAATLDSPETGTWRERSLARFRAVGWNEAVGLMLISSAFAELARENDYYPHGKTLDVVKPSEAALDIIHQIRLSMEPSGLALREGAPTLAILMRKLPESSGFLQALRGEYISAVRLYEFALAAAVGDRRGILRCRLALVLVNYLAGATAGRRAALETDALASEARALGSRGADIAAAAEYNVPVMRSGGKAVLSYERL